MKENQIYKWFWEIKNKNIDSGEVETLIKDDGVSINDLPDE